MQSLDLMFGSLWWYLINHSTKFSAFKVLTHLSSPPSGHHAPSLPYCLSHPILPCFPTPGNHSPLLNMASINSHASVLLPLLSFCLEFLPFCSLVSKPIFTLQSPIRCPLLSKLLVLLLLPPDVPTTHGISSPIALSSRYLHHMLWGPYGITAS